MLRDITLGQYYPAKSIIHQLDPRVKLVTTILYIISLFVAKGIAGYAVATVFLVMVVKMSKVPFRYITKGLKAVIMILMITVIFNLFMVNGEVELWRFGFLRITDKGLRTAVFMAIRLIYLIIGSSIMTLTTTPNDLTDGLEKLLGPLKKVRVLLVPLFISAFRRANDLAMAMEARCYHGGDGRTKMKPLHYESRDKMAYGVSWGYLLLMAVLSFAQGFYGVMLL